MEKFLKTLIILTFLLADFFTSFSVIAQDMDDVYKNSFRPDIPRSLQDIPYDDEEYHGTHYSPYALIRIPRLCKYDKETLAPGFYLVKVFSENSVNYLLFKRQGAVAALVPVIDKREIPKKAKKANAELIEVNHGDDYIVTVNFILNSYSVKLNIVD